MSVEPAAGEEKNPRGIPKAPFIVRLRVAPHPMTRCSPCACALQADVAEYVGGPDADVEATLKRIQDALA
jgi:hypothetical protein